LESSATRKQTRATLVQMPPLPKSVDQEGTRGKILGVALALFEEKGYGATTVRDIAGKVGLLAGSLYAHFPSKEKILGELILIGQNEHTQSLCNALLSSPPNARAQLIALTSALVKFHIEYQTLAIVCNSEMHLLSPDIAQPAIDLRDQSLQILKDVIANGRQQGEFKFGDLILTTTVVASLGARIANWYTEDYPLNPDQLISELNDIVCRIVGAKYD
jgi:AcrR family transcriptional regulator